jgi:nucleotide-binding universal stress UspA family protein
VAGRHWPAGSTAHVVAAVDPSIQTALASSAKSVVDPYARPLDDDPQAWIARAADVACSELRAAGLGAEPLLIPGKPARVLVEHAATIDADCVFLGAQGLGRVERLLLGSVSASVAARAHCSVEVVRSPSR